MNNFQNSSVTVPPHARAQAHARVGMRMSVHMPDRAAPVQRQHHLRVRGLAREWGDGSGCCALHISYYRQKNELCRPICRRRERPLRRAY